MIKNIIFLLIGAIITILVFNGIFAGINRQGVPDNYIDIEEKN